MKVLGAYKDSMKKLISVHHPPMYWKESVINLIQKMSTRGESQDLTASKEDKVWTFMYLVENVRCGAC